MTYKVTIRKAALKALEKINEPSHSKLRNAIIKLGNNPRPHGYKKLVGREGYRIREGDYRIIYLIADSILIVDVIDIGHRKDIYE